MILHTSSVLVASSYLAQDIAPLAINGWWVIVILLVLIVVISLLLLGNRQVPDIPPLAAHEHDHQDADQAADIETEKAAAVEISLQDDLKKIEGIGPKIAMLLNENGIYTFHQLANSQYDLLNRILDEARLTFADPTTWPEQASLAEQQDWDALEALQGRLKAGRKEI